MDYHNNCKEETQTQMGNKSSSIGDYGPIWGGLQRTTKLEKYLAVYFRKDLYPTLEDVEDVPDFLLQDDDDEYVDVL